MRAYHDGSTLLVSFTAGGLQEVTIWKLATDPIMLVQFGHAQHFEHEEHHDKSEGSE